MFHRCTTSRWARALALAILLLVPGTLILLPLAGWIRYRNRRQPGGA